MGMTLSEYNDWVGSKICVLIEVSMNYYVDQLVVRPSVLSLCRFVWLHVHLISGLDKTGTGQTLT